ncbi:MAG: hypothetical protein IPI23_00950 [Bacteroidetes bacterium]|nr:hypothetical protein [Bacteroidota bacterium]
MHQLNPNSFIKPVQLLPAKNARIHRQKLKNGSHYKINDFINWIKDGEYAHIASEARGSRKEYKFLKQIADHCIVGSISKGHNLSHDDIDSFTGWIYCDIDDKDIKVSGFNVEDLKQILYDTFPWIVAIWKSFSGKGLGFLVFCPLISSIWNYTYAYSQIEEKINEEIEICLDPACKSPVRKCVVSWDPQILFREDGCEFIFEPRPEPPSISTQYQGYAVDDELYADEELVEEYRGIWSSFYWSCVLMNKESEHPVLYNKDVILNLEIHKLVRYFPEQIIMEYHHNEEGTLAYIPKGVCCIKLLTHKHTKVYYKYRASTLCNILIKYNLFWLLKTGLQIDKNEIFNHLIVLNKKCYDQHGFKKMPLEKDELNRLSIYIYQKIVTDSSFIKVSRKTTIISHSFYNKLGRLYGKPVYILREVNKINSAIANHVFIITLNKVFTEMHEKGIRYPEKSELAMTLSLKLPLTNDTILNKLYKCDFLPNLSNRHCACYW